MLLFRLQRCQDRDMAYCLFLKAKDAGNPSAQHRIDILFGENNNQTSKL